MATAEVIEQTALQRIVSESGLSIDKAAALMEAYAPLVAQAGDLVREAQQLHVTDATQVTEIRQARLLRLKLKDVRVAGDHAHKELKADILKNGKAIDASRNWLKERIEPEEARLLEMEEIAIRAEAARKAALKASRETLLAPFGVDTSYTSLGEMPEEAFTAMLNSAKLAHEARIAAEAKAEADRIAVAKAAAEEQARIRADNERLRLEAEAREKAAAAEREQAAAAARAAAETARKEREAIEAKAAADRAALEAQAKKEREAREKAEKVIADQKRAEAVRLKAEADAAKRAAQAPDREKLLALSAAIEAVPLPTVGADFAAIVGTARSQLSGLAKYLRESVTE